MSYWERNTLILLAGSMIGATFYFGFVIVQSLTVGAVIMPKWWVWIGYIAFQFAISVGGTLFLSRNLLPDVKDLPRGQDEPDRLIKSRAETWQGHITAAAIFAALALWFVHQNPALLFHSIVAGLLLGEIGRGIIQFTAYNRAI